MPSSPYAIQSDFSFFLLHKTWCVCALNAKCTQKLFINDIYAHIMVVSPMLLFPTPKPKAIKFIFQCGTFTSSSCVCVSGNAKNLNGYSIRGRRQVDIAEKRLVVCKQKTIKRYHLHVPTNYTTPKQAWRQQWTKYYLFFGGLEMNTQQWKMMTKDILRWGQQSILIAELIKAFKKVLQRHEGLKCCWKSKEFAEH